MTLPPSSRTVPRGKRPSCLEDWEQQRDNITRYYIQKDYTLSALRTVMLSDHGFNATNRQYTDKLKQWNLRKNLKPHVKDQIVDQIAAEWLKGRNVSGVTVNGQTVELGLMLRHARSRSHNVTTSQTQTQAVEVVNRVDLEVPTLAVGDNDAIQITYSDECGNSTDNTLHQEDDNGWETISSPAIRTAPLPLVSGVPNTGRMHAFRAPDPSDSLQYEPTKPLEKIVFYCQDFILKSWRDGARPSRSDVNRSDMDTYWTDIANALYMVKKERVDLAVDFSNKACERARKGTFFDQPDVDTLRNLLATLSTINTSLLPSLRDTILGYLTELFEIRLHPLHPLVHICRVLKSEPTNAEISERALRSVLEVLEVCGGQRHIDTLQVREALVRLLRRSGDLDGSESLCKGHLNICASFFGQDALPTRRATQDLVHITMAKKEWRKALDMCESRMKRDRDSLGRDFPDELAVYEIEDLAELYSRLGQGDEAHFVLHEAYFGARRLWGEEASSTVYIREKIRLKQA